MLFTRNNIQIFVTKVVAGHYFIFLYNWILIRKGLLINTCSNHWCVEKPSKNSLFINFLKTQKVCVGKFSWSNLVSPHTYFHEISDQSNFWTTKWKVNLGMYFKDIISEYKSMFAVNFFPYSWFEAKLKIFHNAFLIQCLPMVLHFSGLIM